MTLLVILSDLGKSFFIVKDRLHLLDRSGPSRGSDSIGEHLVIEARADLVVFVIHRAASVDAKARRLFDRVNVGAQEDEFPVILLFLHDAGGGSRI